MDNILDRNAGLNKVAHVTLAFWIMKICATTVGETGGDLIAQTMNIGYLVSTIILLGFFCVTLFFQLRSNSFHPWLYWAVILSTSTAGTTLSDYMDRTLQLGYAIGAAIIATVLVVVLIIWKIWLGSLKVDHISDPKIESMYWLAILSSNTLGTALGDYLADSSGLGYLWSNALISSGIAIVILAYFTTKISRTILFWIAFVLTRPFGATMGDLLTKSHDKGGMDLGTLGSSAVLLTMLGALIWWTHQPKKEVAAY